MTMPVKIWAEKSEFGDGFGVWVYEEPEKEDTAYIRKDLADELARALEQVDEALEILAKKYACKMTEAELVIKFLDRGPLVRYRAATK